MAEPLFPRTEVGGVSLPRLLIGSNWFRGFTHTSAPKDQFIRDLSSPAWIGDILAAFMRRGVDALMVGDVPPPVREAIDRAEQAVGGKMTLVVTPHFNIRPGGPPDMEPERVFDRLREDGATFALPHQAITDTLLDRLTGTIRDLPRYTAMIRERGMIPGLSTHMPETPGYADANNYDVETYIQIHNAAGFLMQVEADWVMRIIRDAKKPVMTIKPLAAGRLLPTVGLAYAWSTIRPCDMVTVGCMSPAEAEEVVDISLAYLDGRIPSHTLQTTRSKKSLKPGT